LEVLTELWSIDREGVVRDADRAGRAVGRVQVSVERGRSARPLVQRYRSERELTEGRLGTRANRAHTTLRDLAVQGRPIACCIVGRRGSSGREERSQARPGGKQSGRKRRCASYFFPSEPWLLPRRFRIRIKDQHCLGPASFDMNGVQLAPCRLKLVSEITSRYAWCWDKVGGSDVVRLIFFLPNRGFCRGGFAYGSRISTGRPLSHIARPCGTRSTHCLLYSREKRVERARGEKSGSQRTRPICSATGTKISFRT
jgi:hypothetical protein